MLNELPLPPPGGTPKAVREIQWPEGEFPKTWVCLMPAPLLFKTHWCPGLSEPGSRSKGRSVPCLRVECPRCPHPRRFPPQTLLVFAALNPKGERCVCVTPGHIANDVLSNPAYSRSWLAAELTLARAHKGRTSAVVLTDLKYRPAEGLPLPLDVFCALEKMWKPYLPEGWDGGFQWKESGQRDPGEEG